MLESNTNFVSEIYASTEQRQEKAGYSQAVDMWSVGCITATILTNQFIFPDNEDIRNARPIHVNYMESLAALDKAEEWKRVSRRAKSFVRDCLAMDERSRMTAKQGLLHPWLTDPHYAAALEAAYHRAIQDWKPRTQKNNLIEVLDATVPPSHEDHRPSEVKSRHFAPASVQQPVLPAPKLPLQEMHFPSSQNIRGHTPLPPIGVNSPKNAERNGAPNKASLSTTLGPDPPTSMQSHKSIFDKTANYSIQEYAPPVKSRSIQDSRSRSNIQGPHDRNLTQSNIPPNSNRRKNSSLDLEDLKDLERRLQLAAYNSHSKS